MQLDAHMPCLVNKEARCNAVGAREMMAAYINCNAWSTLPSGILPKQHELIN